MKQVLAIQKLEKNHKQKSCFWKKIDAYVTIRYFLLLQIIGCSKKLIELYCNLDKTEELFKDAQ